MARRDARRFVLPIVACLVLGGLSPQVAGAEGRPEVTDVAHRGASAYAPENTLAAVVAAADLGASVVEIDVQRTADGELVLMHDTDLVRTTDAEEVFPGRDSYDVVDFTSAEVDRLDAGSWFDPSFAGEPVPTLAEALDLMRKRKVALLLEVKAPARYPGIELDIADELARHPWWLKPSPPGKVHRLVVQSFDWESMRRSQDLLPDVPHGLLGRVDEADIPTYATWADQINPSHTTADAAYVSAVQEAGLEVFVYTVNDADDMRAQIENGVDGIITNYPDVLLDVIAEGSVKAAA
ncbi:glycerophosphodiester phosphodiesterase [Actinophytocola gossypii]|uniref:Glycerophosphodiester phosphodiesterase n=1 Tax=Actinophytocola gossypii TaxID=2812003 RepID=A0ABT2J9R5_9PSEU|nr:glycerophosphodiester phosphodiesterase family protein [Actinophytocola gossypii]MCT2584610.1 glycerophosphodiester phosphodiesterase [Actinophytocola gossypii]